MQGKEVGMKTKALILVFVALLLASNAFAGWVIKQAAQYEKEAKEEQTLYFQKNKVKFVHKDASMIFNVDEGTMCFVKPDNKQYWCGTPQEMRKAIEDATKSMMEEQMKNVPPEQREMMKKYMEQAQKKETPKKEISVKVKKTGDKATVAGYSGTKYRILVDGKLTEELWIAPKITIGTEIDRKKWEKMQKAMAEIGGAEAGYSASEEYLDVMEEGGVIKSIAYYEKDAKGVTVATKIEKKKIPASEFQVPKGYKKVSLNEVYGQPTAE